MENSHFTLKPLSKQAFQIVQPEQSHPRLSLRRVLYVKFLRWVEHAPPSALMKAILRCSILVALLLAYMVPQFALGFLVAAYHSPLSLRVATYLLTLFLMLNVKPLYRLAKRMTARQEKHGNQHTYHGIPLDTFATYLFEKRSFATTAIDDLGLSQRKWAKMADELEHNGILTRGESNARVLGDIDRPTLVRQLRDGFPLVFDPVGKTWCEKRGSFDQWTLAKERREAKEGEQRDRLERKEDKMRANIKRMQEQQSVFQSIMAGSAA